MTKLSDQNWYIKAVAWSQDPSIADDDRQYLEKLIHSQKPEDLKTLEEIFYQELDFGTAGLRGIVGIGSNRMNIYNIKKATHALSLTIKTHFKLNNAKVAISYDSRNSSAEFAKTASEILAAHGIKSVLMPRPMATPILSFAVRYFQCSAGIMVTASHNPKNYNGYKVYWSDGAQITSPIDHEIIKQYNSVQTFTAIPYFNKSNSHLIEIAPESFFDKYYEELKKCTLRLELCRKEGKNLKIIYTPLHGTGAEPIKKIFEQLGFSSLYLVPEQEKPDGNFPTAEYPNPEDPKALTLALNLMKKMEADVAIGSDPDTDRMGVIIRHNNKYEFLSGNDIATFLLYYKLLSLKEQNKINDHSIVYKSIVTSNLQKTICDDFGVPLVNTLTGFKWMAEAFRKAEAIHPETNLIFASEESFGSMPNSFVRDKDGIAAAILMCEALLYFKSQGKNYFDVKTNLENKYGIFLEEVLNFHFEGVSGAKKMAKLMQFLKQPNSLKLQYDEIKEVLDFTQTTSLNLPKASMLGIKLKSGSDVYVRPSGTEPKIKFYLLLNGKNKDELNKTASTIKSWIHNSINEVNMYE